MAFDDPREVTVHAAKGPDGDEETGLVEAFG
jgi:hypothetical protein